MAEQVVDTEEVLKLTQIHAQLANAAPSDSSLHYGTRLDKSSTTKVYDQTAMLVHNI